MADKLPLDRYAMKDRATAHLRIFVGGIPDGATADDLYEHFINFGQINGIIINKNFGFIQFAEESSVREAIFKANGSLFQGKTLSVRTATSNADKPRQTDTVTIQPAIPHAVALSEMGTPAEEEVEEYDNYGNYVGDQSYEEEEGGYNQSQGNERGGRGRGRGRGGRGRGGGGRGGPAGFRDRSPLGPIKGKEWPERGGFDRYPQNLPDYHRSFHGTKVPEKNDCEIIVVSKALTEYAEYIEGRLKRLGIVVDLLFPLEDVPIGKVLGNVASRGCLYAILVMPQNQEHNSLTLTILHGLPQEHRNMPVNDALQLLSRNYQEVQRGGPSGREAVYALLGQLADGRTLTVLQYDKVLEYLKEKREQQVKIEVGEPPANTKTQVELQQRILSILNDKKVVPPSPVPEPAPVPPPSAGPPPQNKLLNDPSVRKALDSILQKFV